MGTKRPQAVVLDAGALIALERADARMRALLREALRVGADVHIPAGALAQALRDPARQVALRALLKAPVTTVDVLDQPVAEAAGILCGRTRTSDVIDASVVLSARRAKATIVTSDAEDLARLDPSLRLAKI